MGFFDSETLFSEFCRFWVFLTPVRGKRNHKVLGLAPWVLGTRLGRTPRGSCNRTRLLEGFLEGSLKEVLLRRVLRRHLVKGFKRDRGS